MISYTDSLTGIDTSQLEGFFAGWPNPPSPETHLRILQGSAHVLLALDDESGRVVGFINAISDGVLSAYIPLLEVLPEWRKKGVGKELVGRMLSALEGLYMVDLTCDRELQPWYEGFGLLPSTGMMLRNYGRQGGRDQD
jgi:GNAT superfamily N-acetyltransferase